MSRVGLLSAALGWVGAMLLLADLPWFRRLPLRRRVGPYQQPTAWPRSAGPFETIREVLGPLVSDMGESAASLLGVSAPLANRLARIGDMRNTVDFRLHQTAWAAIAFIVVLTVGLRWPVPAPMLAALALIAPVLTFLVIEHRITRRADDHRERITAELPVIAEQLAMLLQAGYSLNTALTRIAARGSGAISSDLEVVTRRVQQGLSTDQALQEWAAVMDLEPLTRVVAICALEREVGDIGPLMSEEARAVRLDAQRRLVELIERRNEQVWIPVTVATLVPGLILLAIPFVDALQTFSVGP